MTRKAQMLGQIIVFILGLLVVSGVILFGYQVIKGIDEDRCDVARVQFSTQLSTLIDRNRGWGTSKQVSIEMPCEVEYVCFVDRRIIDTVAGTANPWSSTWVSNNNPSNVETIIEASVNGFDPTNIFTVKSDGTVEPVERFSGVSAPIMVSHDGNTEPAAMCIKGDITIDFRMEGTGSAVRIRNV